MKIFCSGIGGIGLSAYAAHMKSRGHSVSGSDPAVSDVVQSLVAMGIPCRTLQDGSAVGSDTELFVYSEAVPEDHPERVRAKSIGIRQLNYFAAVGDLTSGFPLICTTGTHGKSSTTAMLAKIFLDAGRDPNVIVGTKVPALGNTNWRSGSGPWILEACEYRRSFLALKPTAVLVTNVDGDHFDAFSDLRDYHAAFTSFLSLLPPGAPVIFHGADASVHRLVEGVGSVLGIDADAYPLPTVSTPGLHMRQNAQLALAYAVHAGIPEDMARRSLEGFTGTWRRMEIVQSTSQGTVIIDDYAHHPTEIRATLKALREEYPGRRLICAFQPHTHDRTLKLWDAFLSAFSDASAVVVLPVYDARPVPGAPRAEISKLARGISEASRVETIAVDSLEAGRKYLEVQVRPRDVIVTMGAGNITTVGRTLSIS